jgi:hypothetical protein
MSYPPFKNRHAALAEKGERPKIHVFDLTTARMKKTLTAVEVKGKVSTFT